MGMEPMLKGGAGMLTRVLAVAAFACTVAGLQAQQAVSAETAHVADTANVVAVNTDGPLNLNLAHAAGITYSSSSPELEGVDPAAAERLNLSGLDADATQPPPRRRYGRPRYNDSSHNPDGSNKYAFVAGVGFTTAVGNTYHYLDTSYDYQVGAGRNFNKNFSLMFQFDWDNFGFNGRTLVSEQNLNNFYFYEFCNANPGNAACANGPLTAVDGNSHIWSFSLNPVYNIYTREGLGAYIVGGVGFYHKVANFTTPEVGEEYDPYTGGIDEYEANATFDHYTSNAPGFNGGFGLTFKPSRFSSQRLYAEARYVFVDNSQRFGVRYGQSAATLNAYNGSNLYPANSNRTTYIPIKFGIRF